jgi:hypothetical protein
MVDVDEAVCVRKEQNGIVMLLVLLVARECMRLDVCEVAQLCWRPCRTSKRGGKIRPIVESLDGGR